MCPLSIKALIKPFKILISIMDLCAWITWTSYKWHIHINIHWFIPSPKILYTMTLTRFCPVYRAKARLRTMQLKYKFITCYQRVSCQYSSIGFSIEQKHTPESSSQKSQERIPCSKSPAENELNRVNPNRKPTPNQTKTQTEKNSL